MLTHEPSLRFWLRYAESQGALVESAGDQALVLLPEPLREEAGLAEDAIVTSDPDVAREDGAVLLIAGHPALERAASNVLEAGDVARLYLPWPGSKPPATTVLEARARERFGVDHGRIDALDRPRPGYVPLLRVGALISYAASLSLRFQEQEEAWVDGRTGLPVPGAALEALGGALRLREPDTSHTCLESELARALAGAHAQLERRTAARRGVLAAQARRTLESELARADVYYQGMLESIERRRGSASPDRLRLLDAQADATRAEHARRRREIEEEHQARHTITPFRLHLVHAPAFVLPVDIRRGSRRFPFAFAWLAGTGAFADVRCPACGVAEVLVAGRERLGCRSCLASPPARREPPAAAPGGPPAHGVPPAAAPTSPPARREPPAGGPTSAPAEPVAPDTGSREPQTAPAAPARTGSREGGRAPQPASRSAPRPRSGAGQGGARRPPPPPRASKRSRGRATVATAERTGSRLALAFWQAVAEGDRWPRRKVVRESPLGALYRLYGPAGPLCAIGVPPGNWPAQVTAATFPSLTGTPQFTAGEVTAARSAYPYVLVWWLQDGRPVIGEVMPSPTPLVLGRDDAEATVARLQASAPSPGAPLDPVAAALWQHELPAGGLPLTVRCLATWWRLEGAVDPHAPPTALAAAVASAVARAAGMRRSRTQAAASYGAAADAVERVARHLGSSLRLDRARGW